MLLLGAAVAPAYAVTFGFSNISNNSGIAASVGSQLHVDATQDVIGSTAAVRFTFTNVGGIASSITDIYFDGASRLADIVAANIHNSAGVLFTTPANPGNLPGGNNALPPFSADGPGKTADSGPPAQPNGVNNSPLESVAIVMALLGSNTFNDVISDLVTGALRIGLHVQGIGTQGASDAYINTTPLPGALPLFATGLVSLALLRRRRKTRNLIAA